MFHRSIKQPFQRCFEALNKNLAWSKQTVDEGDTTERGASIFQFDPKLRNGLLSLGGRLERASMYEDLKYPYILLNDHHVTELIIRHNHRNVGHIGQESLLSSLRERFWAVEGRTALEHVL